MVADFQGHGIHLLKLTASLPHENRPNLVEQGGIIMASQPTPP